MPNKYETPRGLTAEQGEEQRTGTKLDERQVREAAQRRPPIEHPTKSGSDEVADTNKEHTSRRNG